MIPIIRSESSLFRRQQLVSYARSRARTKPPLDMRRRDSSRESDTIVSCTHIYAHPELSTRLIFTRDCGMHTSGWWKNPDYERCEHLSLSFVDTTIGEIAPQDKRLAREWCTLFFGDSTRLLWVEAPYSAQGKRHDTWHYRLFLAPDWKTPILPRGEVYSREFTAAGWKSWSDVHGEERLG